MLKSILFEATEDSLYDPEDDTTAYKLEDTRKPKLTLKILNKLRMYREFKKNEINMRNEVVAAVYEQPEQPAQPGMGM
ncbi:hypothetical protein XaC1_330 [Xanthomonas phage XaC1]|jgi:hypothetical protein|nr:hypothetical protein XaC1_330 [Xanthomonas phage XaC1]